MRLIVKRKVAEMSLESSEYLLPLFEAVINAVEAIEETKSDKGLIRITSIRDDSQQNIALNDLQPEYKPIKSFRVEDNGIGFNELNFISFNDGYTEHKSDRGGKGVGRFTILKAFNQVKVNSKFRDKDDIYEREFTFDRNKEVTETKQPELSKNGQTGSIVELSEYYPLYLKRTAVSGDDIAERLVEHCLVLFISKRMPRVLLIDGGHEIELGKIYERFMQKYNLVEMKCNEIEFKAYFIHKYCSHGAHKICFCSNGREVENVQVKNHIVNLSHQLEDEKGRYSILVYVISDYLDRNVYEVRNKFNFPRKERDKDTLHELSLEELIKMACDEIENKYTDDLMAIEKEKLGSIESFVIGGGGVEYRHLLKNPKNFKNIAPNQSKEKLDAELHRINYELESKHKKEAGKLLQKKTVDNYEEYEKQLRDLVKREHEFNISKLANYVVRRKVIIKVFDKLLGFNTNDNKYNLEADLHNIVFPMGEDSETISHANHNLWLLDEKLTFHTYVTSDMQIRSMKTVESTSSKEPDIAIFDKRYAFASGENQYQSIIIFEFKRPGRIMSNEERDVHKQITGYFEALMQSKSKDYRGTLINLREDTPKFGYVICEVDKDLEAYLKNFGGFRRTTAGTFYQYFEPINLYIEVMNYKTMLENVELRHKAFFKQLGIEYL